MLVRGRLLDIEHRAGNFKDRTNGDDVAFDFVVLWVLEGRNTVKVRLPKEIHVTELPFSKDDDIEVDVSVPEGTKCMLVSVPVAI